MTAATTTTARKPEHDDETNVKPTTSKMQQQQQQQPKRNQQAPHVDFERGKAHCHRREWKEALSSFQQALRYFQQQERKRQQHDNDEDSSTMTASPPDNHNQQMAECHRWLGLVLYKRSRLTQSMFHLQTALNIYNTTTTTNHHPASATTVDGDGVCRDGDDENRSSSSSSSAVNMAQCYNIMGSVLVRQGRLVEAMHHYEKAMSLFVVVVHPSENENDNVVTSSSGLVLLREMAKTYNNMANLLQQQGDLEEALDGYEHALSILTKMMTDDDYSKNDDHDDDAKSQRGDGIEKKQALELQIAFIYTNMAHVLEEQHQETSSSSSSSTSSSTLLSEARNCYEKGLAIYKQFDNGERDKNDDEVLFMVVQDDIAHCHNRLGHVFQQEGNYTESLHHFQKALALMGDEGNNKKDGMVEIAELYHNIANVMDHHLQQQQQQQQQGTANSEKCAAVLEHYQKALHVYKRCHLEKTYPVAQTYYLMAGVYQQQQEGSSAWSDALNGYHDALAIYTRYGMEESSLDVAHLYHNMGTVYQRKGSGSTTAVAMEYYQKSLRIYEMAETGEDGGSLDVTRVCVKLGALCLSDRRKLAEARTYLSHCSSFLSRQEQKEQEVESMSTWPLVITCKYQLSRLAIADSDFSTAIANCESILKHHHIAPTCYYKWAYTLKAQAHEGLDGLDEAEECYRTVLAVTPNYADAHVGLLILLNTKTKVALEVLERSESWKKEDGPEHEKTRAMVVEVKQKFAAALEAAKKIDPTIVDPVDLEVKTRFAATASPSSSAAAALSEMDIPQPAISSKAALETVLKRESEENRVLHEKIIKKMKVLEQKVDELAMDAARTQKAIDYYRESLQIKAVVAPDSLDVSVICNKLGDLYVSQTNLVEARSFLSQSHEILMEFRNGNAITPSHPALIECKYNLGRLALAESDSPQALSQAEYIIEHLPKFKWAHCVKAQALQGLNRLDEAEGIFQDLLSDDFAPNYADAHVGLLKVLNEETKQALDTLENKSSTMEEASSIEQEMAQRGAKESNDKFTVKYTAAKAIDPTLSEQADLDAKARLSSEASSSSAQATLKEVVLPKTLFSTLEAFDAALKRELDENTSLQERALRILPTASKKQETDEIPHVQARQGVETVEDLPTESSKQETEEIQRVQTRQGVETVEDLIVNDPSYDVNVQREERPVDGNEFPVADKAGVEVKRSLVVEEVLGALDESVVVEKKVADRGDSVSSASTTSTETQEVPLSIDNEADGKPLTSTSARRKRHRGASQRRLQEAKEAKKASGNKNQGWHSSFQTASKETSDADWNPEHSFPDKVEDVWVDESDEAKQAPDSTEDESLFPKQMFGDVVKTGEQGEEKQKTEILPIEVDERKNEQSVENMPAATKELKKAEASDLSSVKADEPEKDANQCVADEPVVNVRRWLAAQEERALADKELSSPLLRETSEEEVPITIEIAAPQNVEKPQNKSAPDGSSQRGKPQTNPTTVDTECSCVVM